MARGALSTTSTRETWPSSPRPHPLPAEPRLRTGDIPGCAKLGGPWGGDDHDQLLPAAQRGYPGERLPNLVSFQVVAVGTSFTVVEH